MSTTHPALAFTDVVKSFGSGPSEVRALTDVTLSIDPGEFVAVMGPSGCGKSTLLHLAGALDDADAGQVEVFGHDVSTMNAAARAALRRTQVGFVFQRLNLIPSLTAIENVTLPLELEGIGKRDGRGQATDMLEMLGVTEQLDRYPDDFSGGQQQRIAIARAVVGSRQLVLADEPTGALDTVTGDLVVEMLAGLPARTGASVVLVTHEPRFAAWADRVVFLRDGRIVDQTATTSEVADADPFMAGAR
jgi:putative ABC transport system ATP-binding protein